MSEEFLEQLEPLSPIDFFALSTEIYYSKNLPSSRIFRGKYHLPDTSEMIPEERFADICMAWNEEGLMSEVFVDKPFAQSQFPRFDEGDSLELFIDTRDLKTAGYMTRFCHHFLILPKETNGVASHEITTFRSDDAHPLCDPQDIFVESSFSSSGYQLQIIIPSHCLHGYDPSSFDRLGFTYKLNRYQGQPQHFSVSSRFYALDKHPSMWASLKMIK